MQELRLKIGKMTCVNCANAIEKLTQKIDGVKGVSVSYVNSSGVFLVQSKDLRDKIVQKIKSLGYEILADDESIAIFKQKELLKLRRKLILSWLVSIAAMILMTFTHDTSLLQAFLGCFGVFYCGVGFYKRAFAGLTHKSLDMNTLIALGSFCAILYSFLVYFRAFAGHLYFAEASMIVSFVLLGKFLEENAKFKAQSQENSLLDSVSKTAFIKDENGIKEVPSALIKAGDTVLVRDGESVSVDGVVICGRAEVDLSAINGEFLPVVRQNNDEIEAGSIVVSGKLEIKALKNAMDSKIEVIRDLIFKASNAKMPIAKLADTISAYFVGFIILLAVAVFAFWAYFDGLNAAFLHASAVLLISCPCALGLATPIALVLALNNATKHFILIKNPAALELLRRVRCFVFDKTGTLTKDELSVFAHNLAPQDFELLCNIESLNSHPIARALAACASSQMALKGDLLSVAARGIRFDGEMGEFFAGNETFLQENDIEINAETMDFARKHNEQAPVNVYFAKNRICLGVVCLANELRKEAATLVNFLEEKGLKSVILSGDNEKSVNLIAKSLKISDFNANLNPSEKLETLKKLQKNSLCAFVGDGINDAAALSLANVSFAMNGGSALAKNAGDFVLLRDDLGAISYAFKLSQKAFKIIKQNLFWAFFYNVCCIPVAAGLPSILGRSAGFESFLAWILGAFDSFFGLLSGIFRGFVGSFGDFVPFFGDFGNSNGFDGLNNGVLASEAAASLSTALANFTLTPHIAALAMCFSSIAVVLNSLRLRKGV